jgi:hypothetical protein
MKPETAKQDAPSKPRGKRKPDPDATPIAAE